MSNVNHYFLAIPIPEKGKAALEDWSERVQPLPFEYKEWVDKEDFHMTLKFYGGVESERLIPLTEEIHRLCTTLSSFPMKGKGVGTFGKPHSPRVLWAGVESDPALFQLQEQLDLLSDQHGFGRENRPYRPHITIAKKWVEGTLGKDRLPALPDAFLSEWVVDRFHLYTIHPTKKPKYEIVDTFCLKGSI